LPRIKHLCVFAHPNGLRFLPHTFAAPHRRGSYYVALRYRGTAACANNRTLYALCERRAFSLPGVPRALARLPRYTASYGTVIALVLRFTTSRLLRDRWRHTACTNLTCASAPGCHTTTLCSLFPRTLRTLRRALLGTTLYAPELPGQRWGIGSLSSHLPFASPPRHHFVDACTYRVFLSQCNNDQPRFPTRPHTFPGPVSFARCRVHCIHCTTHCLL